MTDPLQGGERIQKVLARAGFGSRRSAEQLITDNRVTVNGLPARLGQRLELTHDVLAVDGIEVGILPGLVYYLLNKPAGAVTTSHDPQGRPTVLDLVPDQPRVFAVGRLDLATEGLLVLTNDGQLAQRLTHPSHGVEKEYLVQLATDPSPSAIRALRSGVELAPGEQSAPAKVARLDKALLRITIHEGRNRQVRRMCAAVGYEVTRLVRTRIGSLSDTRLPPGACRVLGIDEVRALERAAHGSRRRSSAVN